MKDDLIELYKPSGVMVKVNENSLDAALALGWTEEDPTTEKKDDSKPGPKNK